MSTPARCSLLRFGQLMQVCGLLSFLSANFGLENNDFRDNATLGLVVFLRYEERESGCSQSYGADLEC